MVIRVAGDGVSPWVIYLNAISVKAYQYLAIAAHICGLYLLVACLSDVLRLLLPRFHEIQTIAMGGNVYV